MQIALERVGWRKARERTRSDVDGQMDASWEWWEREGSGAKEIETPKGSVSILVSEVERSGGKQRQPPGKALVYSPAPRP